MVENERKDDNTGDSGGPLRRERSEASKSPKKLRVLLRTFGCQMNVRDSEVIAGLLDRAGYRITEDEDLADVIIFNTCSVRQHAEDRVWSAVGQIVKKQERLSSGIVPIVGIVGCMANNYQEAIFEKASQVDFVVGTADIHRIPGIINKLSAIRYPCLAGRQALSAIKIWETDGETRPEEVYHTGFHLDQNHAFVVISEGCENYCSYCVVPYTRGKLRSRNYQDILDEIKENIDAGVSKITLLGQNVNAYGVENREQRTENRENINFVKLLELIDQVKGLKEFSFVTSHPKDTTIDLFKVMGSLEKLKKHLHLPIQSGSNKILKLMKRGYTRESFLSLIDNYRKIVQNGKFSTDVIVGFPTETQEDFLDTYNLVRDVQFNAAYIFKYSPRPRTLAESFPDDVPLEEKQRRHGVILELQKKISRSKRVE